ncbi:porin [Prosthecobacter sp.]|jgi:hypothetical protein|uniref:porin n=1 Tax=Prosthecobacter sp. TaxID=1965333 RepID=UPI00378524B5
MFKTKPHSALARVLALLTAVTVALPPTLPLTASPAMEKLFYILKQKGSITADEYELLVQTMKAEESSLKPQTSSSSAALEQRLERDEATLANLQQNVQQQKEEMSKISDNTSPSTMSKADLDALLSDKWYERIKVRGYVQNRFYGILGDDDLPGYHQFNDSSIANDTASIGIRRARLILSGDVTDHLYLYLQSDFNASQTGSTSLQARDIYGDISLDPAREFRVRLGLSKVPYGFTNLQSSQNRYALERPDALNSAVEGERDYGAYFIWAPYEKRNLFKDLVKMGLRGSGDYGVLNFGVYGGQGINQNDRNGDVHYIARAAWPFSIGDQIMEVGASYFSGRYNPNATLIGTGVGSVTPTFDTRGLRDERLAVNAILYPQPFGLEAEWTWGNEPTLSQDMRSINSESLSGGYVQAVYRHVFPNQSELLPFIRWQTFDGARKFANNAPRYRSSELALGIEYIPYPEFEITLMYATGTRTNSTDNPGGAATLPRYRDVNFHFLGLQAQINF